jgi:hypothetical protein
MLNMCAVLEIILFKKTMFPIVETEHGKRLMEIPWEDKKKNRKGGKIRKAQASK